MRVNNMTTTSNPILCHECGAELREGSNFCPICGAERIVTPCRCCEKELDPSDSFCRKCGQVVFADENLEAAVREKLEKPEEPLTKGAIKELALSLIVLVAKLVIGIPLLQPTRSHTRANILA